MAFKNIILNAIFFIAIQAYIMPASAINLWSGVVTHVTDGDTVWVRPITANSVKSSNPESRKIRIDGIDAPEICQLYGPQASVALKQFIFSKTVTVDSKRIDDYGRDVAKITLKTSNQTVDVGAWMVSNGHAWSYHYRHSAGPYRVEEEAATRGRLGLFADSAAIEPRFFRREHGSCHLQKKATDAQAAQHRKRYN